MTDGAEEPAGRGGGSTIPRWLGIAVAIATVVGTVITAVQWAESRPGGNAPASPAASVGLTPDDRFLQVGQCVRNLGDAQAPLMKIADCASGGAMRVAARIEQNADPEPDADALCRQQVPDFTDYHFSDWTAESSVSVIFCLRAE
ncbi:hypothetical protein ACFQZ4_37095 [Catellatospora coxensis]|uniref:Uncharacterized protein n=1 Tax=Catellatospora coxensis TaxID=310354 RepID=A0A8J3KXI7_9ACTN|nr:hypothetical protein [Catellatospora coxensis]GIG03790.1 hypothetical protein Cco03nite_04900 [Catellatospora coxensis]